jgi:branched-chain amino acid transport system permease protein
MWIALTESWIVLSGMTGYISLGHAVFVGLGAYVFVLTWGEVPLWVGLMLAGLTAGCTALLIGLPCLRVRGPYFVILTLGVSEFGKYVVVNIEASLSKFGRLVLGGPEIDDIFRMMLALAVVAFLLAWFVRRSRFGAGLRALREDEEASQMVGISATRLKITAFVVSAIIPGMVGSLLVLRSGYFEPLQVFNPLVSLTIITMATIGGSDDAPGPLLGTIFLVGLSELLWSTAPQLYMVILGALLIFFVLNAPDGLYGRLRPYLPQLK